MIRYVRESWRHASVPLQMLFLLINEEFDDQKIEAEPTTDAPAEPTVLPLEQKRWGQVALMAIEAGWKITSRIGSKDNPQMLAGLHRRLSNRLPDLWKLAQTCSWQHPRAGRWPQRVTLTVLEFRVYLTANRLQGNDAFVAYLRAKVGGRGDYQYNALVRKGLFTPVSGGAVVEQNVMINVVSGREARSRRQRGVRRSTARS